MLSDANLSMIISDLCAQHARLTGARKERNGAYLTALRMRVSKRRWARPMVDPTHFGRKRRARRARGRRIEARRSLGPGHIPFSSARIALQDYWKDEQKRLTIHFIDPSIL
jgi:hypothetical protein